MIREGQGARLPRIVLFVLGGTLIVLGVLAVGYGAWAWAESRAYLAEVAASGQTVEAFDGANFVMSSAGLFLLIGLLLVANGGLFLVAGHLLPRPAVPDSTVPAEPDPAESDTAESDTARPVSREDDLDDLLDEIET
ncbi:hypothetical protein [Nocardiopsis aegyptia]|uniref:Uncharacterized protein n=1 Tax=Nocardiopsis aegyptia TaxID=220378 RepID=A0A7Z0JAF1_9ACTN|nr:hypothetical protein [Nocardiopsis aegyptia]NYJ34365.1 hypothetical protein [Nocardiopsis aegyptia]